VVFVVGRMPLLGLEVVIVCMLRHGRAPKLSVNLAIASLSVGSTVVLRLVVHLACVGLIVSSLLLVVLWVVHRGPSDGC